MSLLYVTADRIGQVNHGAGQVTWHESEALKSLGHCQLCKEYHQRETPVEGRVYRGDVGFWLYLCRDCYERTNSEWQWYPFLLSPCEVWGREQLNRESARDVWYWDQQTALNLHDKYTVRVEQIPELAHFYAGTFSSTVAMLKQNGCKVTYTAAAHSIEESRREHEELGIPYQYDHLTDPVKWARYLRGYADADVLITPSRHSADVMRSFGCKNRIEIIPHGCSLPPTVAPIPGMLTVGYIGNCCSPDKGLRYLFSAWRDLNYKDAILKIAGHDSTSDFVRQLWNTYGGRGNVQFCGWVDDIGEFYGSLSLYVQPSVSEGWGCEVCESQAAGRVAFCSEGAGAADSVPEQFRFKPRDVTHLAELIDSMRGQDLEGLGKVRRKAMENYTWAKVRAQYTRLWQELLG